MAYVIEVTLARAGVCAACAAHLGRGTSAHFAQKEVGARTFYCAACTTAGRADIAPSLVASVAASSAIASAASNAVALEGNRLATAVVVGAASIVVAARSPLGRRLAVTAAVGVRSAFAWLGGRVRGKRDHGPAIVRRAFEDLGPTYVKLGQLIASSDGLFPAAYSKEFQACLDRVRPIPLAAAMAVLEEELGCDPKTVFASITPEPLASASIAQVHAATLKDGSDVVVKIQRPGIGQQIATDLQILRGIARLVAMVPDGALASPEAIVSDFAENLAEELDFIAEAANMDEFNRIMGEHHHDEVAAPRVHHALTTKRVLVMERFYGHRVDDAAQHAAAGADPEEKLLLGLRAWFTCMIHHGFFHGDVHAGNLMALRDGRIGFLDFGVVGRFPLARRQQVADYLLAFASADFRALADVMLAMGTTPDGLDLDALARDLGDAFRPLLAAPGGPKYADLLPVMTHVGLTHRLRLPRELVLVTKQMIYFDRYSKVLAPKLNVFQDPRVITAVAVDLVCARLQMA